MDLFEAAQCLLSEQTPASVPSLLVEGEQSLLAAVIVTGLRCATALG
jgi:hypothetical protein